MIIGMIDASPDLPCKQLSSIHQSDEWWFYQCVGGVLEDVTGAYAEQDIRESLSQLEAIFDNKWYAKRGNKVNSGICAGLLLGGMQNTIPNIMRLAFNITRLGGIDILGRHVRDNLRNPSQCLNTILELEILMCLTEGGVNVEPYPQLDRGRRPDALVNIDGTDIYVEVTAIDWPAIHPLNEVGWKPQEASRIADKCIGKTKQLPDYDSGVLIVNQPMLFDPELGHALLESLRGYLMPELYSRISGIILVSKLAERSGFIKVKPMPIANVHATKRCDEELATLAEALWKYPEAPSQPN